MTLTEKTSSKGTKYLFGWLDDAEVIGFRGDANQWGETWTLFVQEKAQKATQHTGQQRPSKTT